MAARRASCRVAALLVAGSGACSDRVCSNPEFTTVLPAELTYCQPVTYQVHGLLRW